MTHRNVVEPIGVGTVPSARPRRIPAGPALLAAVTLAFLAYTLPAYVGLDPATSRSEIPPEYGWYYPALVTHIFFGTVAQLAALLQLWPWLRRHHPAVHRGVGRVYLAGGVLPAGLVVLTITPVNPHGPSTQVAATLLALLWLGTSLAGYRAARRRRYAEHREWMVRSIALTFAITADRVWLVVCFAVFTPGMFTGGRVDEAALQGAISAALWLSIAGNLLVAQWWLDRTRRGAPWSQTAPTAVR